MPGMPYAAFAYKFVQPHSSILDMPLINVRNGSEAPSRAVTPAYLVTQRVGLHVRRAQGRQRHSVVVSDFARTRLDMTLKQASGSRVRVSVPFVFNS